VNAAIFFLTMLAQTSTETWVNTPRTLAASNANKFVDAANAALYKNAAPELIRETIGIEPRDLYFVIQVARFSDGGEIVKQNWYVYHSGSWSDAQFAGQNRIYGSGSVWFLYIQLNARSGANTTYVIRTTKTTPAYFSHLQTAAGMFGVNLTPTAGEPRNLWNAKLVNIPYVPSSVVITPPSGTSATFDDEGLSRIDFSAAIPVTKAGTPGMFGLADLYLKPVDIKNAMGFGSLPHLVGGLRAGSQPLKNILVGVGWGPLFGGVVLGNGSHAFSFGVNISAATAMSAVKK
jgi:hypothetical protein